MNIENLYDSIQTKLRKYTDFDSNALIYSKNSINGDFMIHVSRLKSFECVQKNLHELEIKHIKKVTFDKNNLCFFVDKQEVAYEILETIYKKDSYFGYQAKKDKLVVIEYSSPNIAKKFHPGHFRNTVLGNFINNLLIVNGYKTHTINYLGDWGKQFGLIGVGYEKYGDENKMKEDPIKHLYDIYVQINNDKAINNDIDEKAKMWFTDLENGKIENVKLWQRFREMSVEKYKSLYKIMNCKFDEYSGESFYAINGKQMINKLEKMQKEIVQDESQYFVKNDEKDNSKYIETKYGKICIVKNDGSTLYSTRDIAACFDRLERLNPDQMLYVVASQQDLYFQQLFDIFHKIGHGYKNNEFILKHINYGMVNGMSTRKGTVVFLEDIINEAKEVMLEKMKKNVEKYEKIKNVDETCQILALSALIVQDFSAKRIKNYDFNMERNTETNGFTGPYLQYMHCRLISIEDKNKDLLQLYKNDDASDIDTHKTCYTSQAFDEKVFDIIYYLLKYPLVVRKCMDNYEPSTMLTYLMDLCKMVNSIINQNKVLGEENKIGVTRLLFFRCVRIVVGNGIRLLGMTPLERM